MTGYAWRAAILAVTALMWGCSGSGGTETADIPDGYGALQLALEFQEAPATPLGGRLTITDRADPSNVVMRDYESLGSTVFLDIIPIAPGKYDVDLEVMNSQGETLYYGSEDNVEIKLGALTQITMTLLPSGSIGIMAKMARYGRVFTCEEPLLDSGNPFDKLTGAQRMEKKAITGRGPGYETRMWYYMWAHHADNGKTYLFKSTNPEVWLFWNLMGGLAGEEVTGLPDDGFEEFDVTVAGGEFFAYLQTSYSIWAPEGGYYIYNSKDGIQWDLIRKLDVVLPEFEKTVPGSSPFGGETTHYYHDEVRHCSLLVDNQFNLFCGAVDKYCSGTCSSTATPVLYRTGVFHSWSPDGFSWSTFPPQLPDPGDNPGGWKKNVNFNVLDENVSVYDSTSVLYSYLDGGVYLVWYIRNVGGYPETHELLSLDRVNWEDGPVIFKDSGSFTCADEYSVPTGAMFVKPGTDTSDPEMHVFRSTEIGDWVSADYRIDHFKSVE